MGKIILDAILKFIESNPEVLTNLIKWIIEMISKNPAIVTNAVNAYSEAKANSVIK